MWGKEEPRWPSLIAVVESAERDVVVELGVPLSYISYFKSLVGSTHGASVGVSGLEGGSGISIRVGVAIFAHL